MRLIFFFAALFLLSSCVEITNTYDKLPPGKWRAELVLDNKNFVPKKGDEEAITTVEKLDDSKLPFNFEVSYDEQNNLVCHFINGDERIEVKEIEYGRDRKTAKDTFRIHFPEYGSFLSGQYEDNAIAGSFNIPAKNNYSIPFNGQYGKDHRFTTLKKQPAWDMNGKWECVFEEGTDSEYKALGEFKQEGNHLTGTFRTETGDYRYLEGTVQDKKAYLSVFDGTHAFLFTMKMIDQDNIIGTFRSGKHYKASWSGKRNNDYELADPSTLTYLTEENPKLDFSFTGLNGEELSLSHEKFQDKIKIVTIMGTWCPNCKDEINFLKEIKSKYKNEIEIMAVGFERPKEKEEALEVLRRYSKKMDVNFPMVYGGTLSKSLASEKFPFLNKVISFPTLFIVDKNNKVKYIHTGFNGPATSKYKDFIKEFNEELEKAIKS